MEQKQGDSCHTRWRGVRTATCELILEGLEKNKDSPFPAGAALYAAVPAHLILSDTQFSQLVAEENPKSIEDIRREVNSQIDDFRYVLQLSDDCNKNGVFKSRTLDLKQSAMIACRHYFKNAAKPTSHTTEWKCCADKCTLDLRHHCPHTYMNDIALIPMELHVAHQLRLKMKNNLSAFRSVQFSHILPLTQHHIGRMITEKLVVYVRDIRCYLVTTTVSTSAQAARTCARHIAFVTIGR